MKLLFIAGLYPKEEEYSYLHNCKGPYLQNAANNYQWAVVEGLVENKSDFYVLSAPFLPSYPFNYRKKSIPESLIFYNNIKIGEVVSYPSIIAIKSFFISFIIKKRIEKWIKNNIRDNEKFCVIVYTPESYFLNPIISLKKRFPNLLLTTIVTDLVDDAYNFDVNRQFFKRIQMNIEIKLTKKNYKRIDKFILLTERMTDKIPEAVNKNIVIEGIAPLSIANKSNENRKPDTIVYTGSFQEYTGIKLLVDAFHKTNNPNYKLILCGYGGCQDYVEQIAKEDMRIVYKGNVPRENAINMQRTATLLINPRVPDNSITKYSFPSKTLEYMLSKTPVLGYKLEGIPVEYYNYIYLVEDNSVDGLSKRIDEVLSLPLSELENKGEEAYNFVVQQKSSYKQVNKMIQFVEE